VTLEVRSSSFGVKSLLEGPFSASPTIKLRWYGRGEGGYYAIVQHSPSCVRAAVVGAACSRSGAAVAANPADASEGGIRAVKNYVAGENWTQNLSFDTMLDGTSSASPTIKPKWYGRGERAYYAIVQQSQPFLHISLVIMYHNPSQLSPEWGGGVCKGPFYSLLIQIRWEKK
jgi:hypothetical protein